MREDLRVKRVSSVLLAVVLCCGLLAGCGGKERDVTCLPHNPKIHISDTKEKVEKEDKIQEAPDGFPTSYKRVNNVKIEGKEYAVGYSFNDDNQIASLIYDSDEASLDEAKKYVESVYGELKEDDRKGEYLPGEKGRYVIKTAGKAWVVGCFKADNGKTRIVISRDTGLD